MSTSWSHHDQNRLIPVDVTAERSLAGAAIVDRDVAVVVWEQLGRDDFHDGRCFDVIEAAMDLDPRINDDGMDWLDEDPRLAVHGCINRTRALAEIAELDLAWLVQLVTGRSAARPVDLVQRVADVADARRCIARLVERLEGLDVDVTALVEADARRAVIADAVIEVAVAFGRLLSEQGNDAAVVDALIELGDHAGLRAGQVGETIAAATWTEDA